MQWSCSLGMNPFPGSSAGDTFFGRIFAVNRQSKLNDTCQETTVVVARHGSIAQLHQLTVHVLRKEENEETKQNTDCVSRSSTYSH